MTREVVAMRVRRPRLWLPAALALAAVALALTQDTGAAEQPGPQITPAEHPEAWNPKILSGSEVNVTKRSRAVPPRVVPPCQPGTCPFAGQTVNVVVSKGVIAEGPLELKDEFEAATGARLNVIQVPYNTHFDIFTADVASHGGKYDASMAGAWWLGELVSNGYIQSYDRFYNDPRFPRWRIEDVLPAPRRLLTYAGKKYMVANDHDGQVMYYRRDLLADPKHQAAFKQKYGYPLGVPQTWDQFRDVAEYFNGKDLNGDGIPDHGVTMALKAGNQDMFHFMSLSAPFVIGPDNPKRYMFDPKTMKPLIDSPGHLRALKLLVELVKFGPREMLGWDLGEGWDHFLAGRAALAFTWGDLGALAQEEGSKVKGKIGTAPLPGTHQYYSLTSRKWIKTAELNQVGNTIGGSWAGVIAADSKAPEATYYLLALMATKEKSIVYAARGWDGVDPGRYYHFLPPQGTARLDDYLRLGWNEADVRDYLSAYFRNFTNKQQLPYLRLPGIYSYWLALDMHLAEAAAGQVSPEAALKATATDFEEITLRLGRERQRRAYRESLEP